MSVAKLKKAVLYYHNSIQDDVLLTLQKSGVCEIIPGNEGSSEASIAALEAKASAAAKVTKCDAKLADLRFLLRFLEPYYMDPVSSIARALGERPGNSLSELSELANQCNIAEESEVVRSFERKLSSIRIEMSQLDNTKAILTNLSGFPYAINIFGAVSCGRLRAAAGSLPLAQSEMWKETLLKEVDNDCEVYLAPPIIKKRDIWGVVMYASERESEVIEICSKNNFTMSELDFSKEDKQRSVSEQLALIDIRQDELRVEGKSIHGLVTNYAEGHVGVFRKLIDHCNILKERYQAFASGEFTGSAVMTSFWRPESDLPDMEAKLAPLGIYELITTDPSQDDNAPSLIRNKPWCTPYDILTKLYSCPQYGTLDPTPKLAPFFFVFFGMCLGDAGYALVIAGLIYYLFWRFKKMPTGIKDFLKLFVVISVSTFIYGSITGSYFGDLFAVVPFLKPLDVAIGTITVMDPLLDPMLVLGISLVLGIIHLFYGMILAFKACWEEENYADAIFDKATWLVLITSLIIVIISSAGVINGIAQGIAIFCSLIIVWYAGIETQGIIKKIASGLFTLYGVTSWLGDVLSYSRLLALGLASASIAMVVNMLGGLLAGIPYVGWLLAFVIVVGGHIFNIAINVLGSFVHSLRLQYVEFFGKFYSGGGREFTPFSCNAKYVNITEK
jgi:V/A-type H+-transporting ATPase subunit I